MTTAIKHKPHLVILGGGFAGIHTYTSLPQLVRKHCHVTLVDKNDHFLFTPLLAEVAGSSLPSSHVTLNLSDVVRAHDTFMQREVSSVNIQEKTITFKDDEILRYDYLVSALGAHTFFYGTPGADTHAHVFKTIDDAIAIKKRCIDLFEQASKIDDTEARKELLSFIIIGGGPTGIELVTEIADLMYETLLKKYHRIEKDDISIMIINGGERILSMFDEPLSKHAHASLLKDNISIYNGIRVVEIKDQSVITKDGDEIFGHTIVWTAGVSAIDLPSTCGTFNKERTRICVNKDLRIPEDDSVFILGDMALYPTKDGRGLPMTAQVARQQGQHTARNLKALIAGKETTDFIYKEKGLLASLGSFDAIGQVFGIRLKGVVAWFLWRGVYLGLFNSWKKRFSILGTWFKNIFTGRKITRL